MTARFSTTLIATALLLAVTFLLTACLPGPQSGPLHALRPLAQPQTERGFAGFDEMILIMPVQLAPQIQGRGLLIRDESGETTASLSHRWAGPLDQQIAETLANNLKMLLGTDNVAVAPGPRYGVTRYQFEVEISEFGCDASAFMLRATYTLSDAASKTILRRTSTTLTQTIDKPGHSGYVGAASQAVAELSQTMATALIAARQSQPVPSRHP